MFNKLQQTLFELSPSVRYVALYWQGELNLASRDGLINASDGQSDIYEEFLVNPTLLTLTRQRGDIDCGGCVDVLIRYGHFYQWISEIDGGHLSIAIEPDVDPLALAPIFYDILAQCLDIDAVED